MGTTSENVSILAFGNDMIKFIITYRRQSNVLLDLVESAVKLQTREQQLVEAYNKILMKQEELLEPVVVKKSIPRIKVASKTSWTIGRKFVKVTKVKRLLKRGDPLKFNCENDSPMLDDKLTARCRIMLTMSSICWHLGDEFEDLTEMFFREESRYNTSYDLESKFKQMQKKMRQQGEIIQKLRKELDEMEKVEFEPSWR